MLEHLESREFTRFALFDETRKFRYVLRRSFVGSTAPHRLCVWMNPSDADDKKDDASIRVGMSFARRWGDGGIVVINVMDLVLTDSRKLPGDQLDAIGIMHWDYVTQACAGNYGKIHNEVMCGWGDAGEGPVAAQMLQRLRFFGLVPCAIATTKRGNPCHPLRKSLALPLLPLPVPPVKNYELEA